MLTWQSTQAPVTVQVVLIISDQDEVSGLWEALFQKKGYVTVQETQANAILTCKVIAPALIVIDLHVHHTQRLMLCTNLRAKTSVPILLLISDCDGDQILDAYNAGVDECILKPVSPAFLVVKSISWLLRRRWLGYEPAPPIYTGI